MRVSRIPPAAKSAEASIVDDDGAVVAQRTVTDRAAKGCVPLARAVGAWASLVLDDELARAHDEEARPEPVSAKAGAPSIASGSPASERAPDEPDRVSSPSSQGAFDVGGAMYLRSGDGSGGVTGFSPFVTFEVARSWLLRSALMLGGATSGRGALHGGARLDLCRRIPGNYIERRGIELDVCAGADGALATDRPVVTVGPSMILRGEIGAGFAVELRGATGAVLVEGPFASPEGPPLLAAGELGLSMRFP